MYLFDKNGNELKIGDWVHFNDGKNPEDEVTLNRIGEVGWVLDSQYIRIMGLEDQTLYKRTLKEIRRVPETEAALYALERER